MSMNPSNVLRDKDEDFSRANRAFALFTLDQRERALKILSTLRYPNIRDRFFEAVYRVIAEDEEARADDEYFRSGTRYPGQ